MRFRLVLLVAGGTALATALWLALRPPEGTRPPAVATDRGVEAGAPAAPAASPKLAASAVLAIDPRANPLNPTPLPPVPATLFNEYLRAKQYRAIYDRLKGTPEGQTAEGKVVLYEILRQCATITEGRRPGYRPSQPRREDFVAGIAPTDPQREKRIAAFDAFFADRCQGLSEISTTQADLMRLLGEAAATGDARAKAMALEQELWIARRAGSGRDGGVTLTDAQVESLKQAMSSKDPEAIRVAGRVFANSWHDYALRVGPEQQPVEPRALMNAFLVLACEYGAPCGAETPRMQQACAFQGHCDAQSYPDYLFYYGSSPHDSQLLVQYRTLVRNGIESGDWSAFQVVRGLPPANNRMTFVPGPR